MRLLIFVIFINHITKIAMYTLNLSSSCAESNYCRLTNITLSPIESIDTVKTTASQLIELIIRDSRLRQIPSAIFSQAQNLHILVMNKCGIINISSDAFNKADYLVSLNLQNNRLSEILDNTFNNLAFLERLYLGYNTILRLQDDAFLGLDHLEYLDLQHNEIENIHSLKNLQRLYFIDLSHNLIEFISEDSFSGHENLKTILLNNNKISHFASNSINSIPHLNVLDISNNDNIETLNAMKIDILLAQNCGLKFCRLNSAFKIFAQNNNLKEIKITDKLSLHEIILHDNAFETVTDFVQMINLDWLDLSNNRITTLKTSTMEHYLDLPSLTYLNLANNMLTNFTIENLLPLQKLANLDLRENNFSTEIDINQIRDILPNLETYNEHVHTIHDLTDHKVKLLKIATSSDWLLIVLSILSFLLIALLLFGLYREMNGRNLIPRWCPQKRHINAGATDIRGMVSHRLNELDSAM